MQPYQEATEEIRRQGELPLKTAKTLGSVGASAATAYLGGGAINRILPFLSKYIPEDLVKKGLSKIDPRYGKFIDKALSHGKSIEEIKDFIGEKIQGSQETKTAPEQRSIIEQYSPELFQFLKGEIDKGRAPLEAGALAQLQEPFKKIIKKMSEDHKAPFSSILQSVFGGAQQAQQPQNQQSVINPNQSAEAAAFSNLKSQSQQPHPNSARGQQLARQQQQGGGDQALLEKFANTLKM